MKRTWVFLISLLCLVLSQEVYSQSTIKWEIDKKAGKEVKEKVPEGKTLLIFDTPVDLKFESSVENIDQPHKNGGQYYLYVSDGPQAITINYFGNYTINFGQLMDPNSLPSLKSKEIVFFRISAINELEYYDITKKEKAKGNIGLPVGVNVSDALVVLNVFPPDMEIEISDENDEITKLSKGNGVLKVFLTAPGNHILKINQSDMGTTSIEINTLETKETRFYLIRKPITLDDYNDNIESANTLDLDEKLIGYWAGNLGSKKTFVDIQDINSGVLTGRLYQDGIYHKITGVVKSKSNGEYYITVSKSQTELSNKSGTLDFFIKMGVGSGIWISGDGQVSDFNIMKANEIPQEHTSEELSKLKQLKSKIEGKWIDSQKTLIESITINSLTFNNNITGTVSGKDQIQCSFAGTINERHDKISLVINIPGDCGKTAGVMMLTLNQNTANGFFTSNDGMSMLNMKFMKYE
ncbi:hypothetical protein ACXR6G_18280 [Ancylomarina sp. YFZ004]